MLLVLATTTSYYTTTTTTTTTATASFGMALLCLEPQGEEAGTLRSASGCDNCPLGLPGNPLPEHPGAGCDPEVPEHERPGRELRRCGSGTLSSVGGTAEQSGTALLPGPAAVVGECGDQTAGHADQARACRPPTGSQEDGGVLPGSQLLRLEGSQVTVAGTGCAESEGARCGAGSEGTQPILRQKQLLLCTLLSSGCFLVRRAHCSARFLLWTAQGWSATLEAPSQASSSFMPLTAFGACRVGQSACAT